MTGWKSTIRISVEAATTTRIGTTAQGRDQKEERRLHKGNMEVSTTYISKTIKYGQVTMTIARPVLDENEREKRTKRIIDGLEHSLRDYLKRC